jgi:hypothetical protein
VLDTPVEQSEHFEKASLRCSLFGEKYISRCLTRKLPNKCGTVPQSTDVCSLVSAVQCSKERMEQSSKRSLVTSVRQKYIARLVALLKS